MRYDERDIMFSRLRLLEGSQRFEDYYLSNPEKKETDKRLRTKMRLKMSKVKGLSKGSGETGKSGQHNDRKPQKMVKIGTGPDASDHEYASSKLMEEYQRVAMKLDRQAAEMKVNEKKRDIPPETMTRLVKEFVRLSGLDAVGIAKIGPDDFYSNRGFDKGAYRYGDEVDLDYKYAIVFAAPLELDYINRAPHMELLMSAMLGYAKSSETASRLSMYIKEMGFDAITDSSFCYHTPISFIAEKAGLGQMGRCNAVVNPKYGNRTKVAAVLTNLPLLEDGPVDFGLKEFCETCGRCRNNCPVKAISDQASFGEDGVKYWEHDSAKCIGMWMNTGTSCGVCMSSCPFSQGVDIDLVKRMKGDREVMLEILRRHDEKCGKRNYIKEPLDFMPEKRMK